jgi:hypothetical protein
LLLSKYYFGESNSGRKINAACDMHGKKINACRILVGNLEGKRLEEDKYVDFKKVDRK